MIGGAGLCSQNWCRQQKFKKKQCKKWFSKKSVCHKLHYEKAHWSQNCYFILISDSNFLFAPHALHDPSPDSLPDPHLDPILVLNFVLILILVLIFVLILLWSLCWSLSWSFCWSLSWSSSRNQHLRFLPTLSWRSRTWKVYCWRQKGRGTKWTKIQQLLLETL